MSDSPTPTQLIEAVMAGQPVDKVVTGELEEARLSDLRRELKAGKQSVTISHEQGAVVLAIGGRSITLMLDGTYGVD